MPPVNPSPAPPEPAQPVDAAAWLRAAGLRVTGPRRAVLRAVEAHPHAQADVLVRSAREQLGRVSVQAVYDVLHALTDAHVLRRVEPAGSPARYELERGDNHHHLACRGCGHLVDVPCARGRAPCLDPAELHGFAVDEAEVLYWGLCPRCRDRHVAPADAPSPSPESTDTRR